ncbi:MAG: NifB/NifX family molybdenum-iron cluster-binding protein [Candidatus Omnitrophota bacterium]
MKICVPIEANEELQARVNAHFGSAPYFIIYDTDKETFEVINNTNRNHMHGMCHPLKVLDNKDINAVACRGMGARAVQKLNEGGIKAYRVSAETVEEIINKYKEGNLEEITIQNACIDHSYH